MKLLAIVAFLVVVGLVYSLTCTSNVRQCLQITCGVNTPAITESNTGCRECGPDDMFARFTSCNPLNGNTKSLIYYWRPPATCVSQLGANYSVLPQPVSGFPCAFTCAAGQYIDAASKSCKPCAAGSFVNNFEIVTENWKSIPPQFKTYCKADNSRFCESWNMLGDYTESGRVANMNNVRSYIEYSVELSQPGAYISFEYAQICDDPKEGLEFIVNDEKVGTLITNSTSIEDYSTFTQSLDPGFYTFVWYIHKESQYYVTNVARIRKITVGGVANALTHCLPCQPGEYSDGTTACKPCPENHFSNTTGATSCYQCPKWTYSTKGSSTCTPDPLAKCLVSDYYLQDESACIPAAGGSGHIKQVKWVQAAPAICDPQHPESYQPPPGGQVSCTPPKCEAGQKYDKDTFTCKYCDKGFYVNTTAQSSCMPCPYGSGTENAYYITSFTTGSSAKVLQTACFGFGCRSQGWRMHGDYIDSGYGNGWSRTVLYITAITQQTPSITIEYTISCPRGSGSLLFGWQGRNFGAVVPCNGNATVNDKKTITLDLTKFILDPASGTLAFAIVFASNVEAYEPYDNYIAKIYKIVLKGTELGGADSCVPCKPGTYADEYANCDPCKPGYFSAGGAVNCTMCPKNTFAIGSATKCTACGKGTKSEAGSPTCYYSSGLNTFNGTIGTIQRNYYFGNTANLLKTLTFSALNVTGRYFINLPHDPQNPHQYCGTSLTCFTQGNAAFGTGISLGDTMNIDTFYTVSKSGIRITSQSLQENCLANAGNTSYYSSTIDLVCNPNIATPSVVITRNTSDLCSYIFEIQAADACPACDPDDYMFYKGECINGKQNIQFIKKIEPARLCSGGFQQDLSVKEQDCNIFTRTIETPMWGLIVAGIIAIVILIAIIVSMVVAFVLFIRNRQLSYQLLHRTPEGGGNSDL